MGITGLIPFLEKASSTIRLKDIRGNTVAVDTYCWLHKGVFSCAEKLARNEDTDAYLHYCLRYVNLLLYHDIKPILVFDGRHLPAKALTEQRRRQSRQESKKKAAELLRLGRIEEARSHMRRCIDVTHEMALKLIRECHRMNVDCIVAPYEADAQMAWLNKVDLAQYIITEDSDLTLFGAKKIIFKLDLNGNGLLVESDKLHLAMGCREDKYKFEKFRRMCILSGCDYLDSLPGIGLAKACKFILKTEEDDMWRALKKIPQYLNMRNLEVDETYIDNFLKAEATFMHMFIYNPLVRRMERLYDLTDFETDERYCSNAGTKLDNSEQAFQLALGNLNPFTLKQLDNWHPDQNFGLLEALPKHKKRAKHKSIWQLSNLSQQDKNDTDNIAKKGQQQKQEKVGESCALYFKKIDFLSKTIDEEINENLRRENAKLAEAELYSMYRNEAMSPDAKRRRYDCNNSPKHNIQNSLPISPIRTIKTLHNPFAKVQTTNEKQKSPVVCENSSLLKVLSPKKCKEKLQEHAINVANTKRSIFRMTVDTNDVAKMQVEVKSRFFAANVKEVNKQQEQQQDVKELQTSMSLSKQSSTDLSAEIDEIEQMSVEKQINQAELYNSPSPNKNVRLKVADELQASASDSGIESITMSNVEISSMPEELIDVATVISSDDNIDDNHDDDNVETIKLSNFSAQILPRLGLTKTKPKTKSKIEKKTASINSGQTQAKLSMFGFQKRSMLK